MNQFTFIGRLTRDPEIQTTKDGVSYTRFTVAVRRPFKNSKGQYDTDFIPMVSWKRLAELVADYCTKGSLISVNGRVVMRHLQKEEDERISVPDMIAENVGFLQLKRNHDNNGEIPVPQETALDTALPQDNLPF
ncbi:single-stranded DNA-binding protein [Salisediminibacterium halotolerans]|uniref:Single-stranded DNA-binding protein n=1 Tax=Salisediminibacterium halotolerans TaxID=517425 RepID=A0A1H9VM38_9BACI|nr:MULTISPECIES: single-stranded DNA-binding protein [Salisediminibacterium]RLJ75485.1 single-strand binding protein [Actinophytocola xinjiangensis]RPE89338.1 single-strand binding protein [Salisediminibacterium halotolerans]TWG36098.1 single-strand binding protein [Salisediminibacterium halotolerans]SES22263.1 single-strand DNA-binding protein [Salisediminibacterium haloalkalitolerans]GEL08022.1 single-stranded DNA-binding protein [Salisediminibacterium halotolerans]